MDDDEAGTARPAAGGDWPARVADTVEDVVAAVHDRVIRPMVLAARVVVFGIVVAAMAAGLGALGAIALVRVLDTYAFGHRVWASDAVVGGGMTLVGLVLWALRRSRRHEEAR